MPESSIAVTGGAAPTFIEVAGYLIPLAQVRYIHKDYPSHGDGASIVVMGVDNREIMRVAFSAEAKMLDAWDIVKRHGATVSVKQTEGVCAATSAASKKRTTAGRWENHENHENQG